MLIVMLFSDPSPMNTKKDSNNIIHEPRRAERDPVLDQLAKVTQQLYLEVSKPKIVRDTKTVPEPCQCPPAQVQTVGMQCDSASLRLCAKQIWTYESTISDFPQSKKALQRFSMIPESTIDWHIQDQLELRYRLKTFKASYDTHAPFSENGMIPIEDDYLLYAMIMAFEPLSVLEIGSGHSTRTAHKALLQLPREASDGSRIERRHTCIEPFRSDVIDTSQDHDIPIHVIKSEVQDVDPSEFTKLKKDDILFIDSSHVIRAFGDTILELVFILPTLPVGVIVHIHDICLPENYPRDWLGSGSSRSEYTEQYMLAAFLYGNKHWKVLWSNWKMGMDHPNVFREIGLPGEKHGSIWLIRVS